MCQICLETWNKFVSLVDRRQCIITVWGTSPVSAVFSNPCAVLSLLWDLANKESCMQDTSKVHKVLWVIMQADWIVLFSFLFFSFCPTDAQTDICWTVLWLPNLCHYAGLWCSFVLKFYYSCRRKVQGISC